MRRAAALLTVALAAGARAEDDAAHRAFVEIATDRTTRFAGERFRVALRIGFDEAFFRERAIATHRRPVDLRVHVHAPWFDALPTAAPVPEDAGSGDDATRTLTFALNDAVVRATQAEPVVRDGRTFAVVEASRDVVLAAEGAVPLEAPTLRFAWASRFEDDLALGEVPLDRRDVSIAGAPSALTVLSLPRQGRPPEFTGAVGRFRVATAAHPRDVAVGESVRLTMSVEGDGDLTRFEAPPLGEIPGCHVLGLLDDRRAGRRTLSWDVAPLNAGDLALAAPTFASFDPEPPGEYRTLRTDPIRIAVRGLPSGADATRQPASEPGSDRTKQERGGNGGILLVVVVAVLLATVCARSRRRAAPAASGDPHRDRVEAALARLRSPDAERLDELAAAFSEYLGARLRCPAAAVVAPDLARRLTAAGVPAGLADDAAAMSERLVGARYGASDAPAAPAREVLGLVEALEGSLRRRPPP